MMQPSENDIKKAFAEIEMQQRWSNTPEAWPQNLSNLRPAAVMIPMLEHQKQWHLLLTNRSETLVEHSGQVAFPGGAREPQDQSLQKTALREMHEEIGVLPEDVEVYGHLGDMPIVTGYFVRPYVGRIPWPYPLEINSAEVQNTYIVPLDWLADSTNRMSRTRHFAGRQIPVTYFKLYEGYQLWGATAEMVLMFLTVFNLTE